MSDESEDTSPDLSAALTASLDALRAHNPSICDPEAGKLCPYCERMQEAERADALAIWRGMKQAGMTGDAMTDEASMRDAGRIR